MTQENTGVAPAPMDSMIFAGGEPITEEDHGDMYAIQGEDPLPDTPPIEPQPAPAAEPAPEPTPEPQAQDPAPADPAEPSAEPPAEPPADPGQTVLEDAVVPSYRLAQEAARRRTAEAQLRDLQARIAAAQAQGVPEPVPGGYVPPPQQPAPEPATLELDFGDDPKQMFDKVLDGDMSTATELFQNMMKKTAEATARAALPNNAPGPAAPTPEQIQELVQSQVVAQRFAEEENALIDKLEAEYDFFNPNSPNFKKEIVDETLALKQAYIAQRYTPADALARAAQVTMMANDLVQKQTGLGGKPPVADPAAVKRNVDAANATPPQMPQGEQRAPDDLDVMKLTDDDVEGLPAATIARLRGDIL